MMQPCFMIWSTRHLRNAFVTCTSPLSAIQAHINIRNVWMWKCSFTLSKHGCLSRDESLCPVIQPMGSALGLLFSQLNSCYTKWDQVVHASLCNKLYKVWLLCQPSSPGSWKVIGMYGLSVTSGKEVYTYTWYCKVLRRQMHADIKVIAFHYVYNDAS